MLQIPGTPQKPGKFTFTFTRSTKQTPVSPLILKSIIPKGGKTYEKKNHWTNNKLKRYFQIRQHHLTSQRENEIMGKTIVLGNKPSSVALHQNLFMQSHLSKILKYNVLRVGSGFVFCRLILLKIVKQPSLQKDKN